MSSKHRQTGTQTNFYTYYQRFRFDVCSFHAELYPQLKRTLVNVYKKYPTFNVKIHFLKIFIFKIFESNKHIPTYLHYLLNISERKGHRSPNLIPKSSKLNKVFFNAKIEKSVFSSILNEFSI